MGAGGVLTEERGVCVHEIDSLEKETPTLAEKE